MLKTIAIFAAITAAVGIAAVLILASTRPATFRVQRSITINASPEKILAVINDFHRWGEWSPYENKDPKMARTFSGSTNGVGAEYAWQGNNEVGHGHMKILSATTDKTVIQLDFLSPFEAHNTAEFSAVPKNGATEFTWAMHGPNNFAAKVMQIFFNMDTMVGADFEVGLANLKTLTEK